MNEPRFPAPRASRRFAFGRWGFLIAGLLVGIAIGYAGNRSETTVRTVASPTPSVVRVVETVTEAAPPAGPAPIPSPTRSPQPTSDVIKVFRRSGIHSLRPFNVPRAWEIQWTSTGDYLAIYLNDAGGRLVDIAANQIGSGKGSYYVADGGEYQIETNAIGEWTIKIVVVP